MTDDVQTRRIADALYELLTALDGGSPYGATVHEIARKYDITTSELNDAYDDHTGVVADDIIVTY